MQSLSVKTDEQQAWIDTMGLANSSWWWHHKCMDGWDKNACCHLISHTNTKFIHVNAAPLQNHTKHFTDICRKAKTMNFPKTHNS